MKKTFFTIMAALLLSTANAQNTFNEMEYSAEKTVFHLNAPSAPTLRIYEKADDKKPVKTIKMKKVGADRWEATVKKLAPYTYYTFDIGKGECPGVFAKAVSVNGKRGCVIDMKNTSPIGWEKDHQLKTASPCDLVIYEMHHRDFSIDASSGIENGGKFIALEDPKAISHLKKLGINAVHILPSFDFATIDETRLSENNYNWGYDPLNYNVPEGSYSTNPYSPDARIGEFKRMVMALHSAGIRVILDVVYNHCNSVDGSNFQRTYPDYYYRLAEPGKGVSGGIEQTQGKYSNGSGCGNETASEKPLMRQFMLESVLYWAKEYHIDGFRFDLMGIHDIETMNLISAEVKKYDPSIFIYGEGWSAGTCAYPQEKLAMKAVTYKLDGIAAFSDDLRDALRGPFYDNHQAAFLGGVKGHEEVVKFGIVGAISHPEVKCDREPWTKSPAQHISYVSCHDDPCLVDRLKMSIPGITEDELIRLDLLAQTAVMTSQGVPFMLSGEEMLRDKKGVHNSYNSPDSINHLDWSNLEKYPQVFEYYSHLIQMRKNHKAFRMGDAETVRQALHFLNAPENVVAWQLNGKAVGDSWEKIIVVLNSNKKPQEIAIPEGEYKVVCRNIKIDENGFDTVKGNKAVVPAQSALILRK